MHANCAVLCPDCSIHCRLDDAGYVNIVGLKGGYYAWSASDTIINHIRDLSLDPHIIVLVAIHTHGRHTGCGLPNIMQNGAPSGLRDSQGIGHCADSTI